MTEGWSATVLTLFPEMFPGPLGVSLAGRALEAGLWRLETVDIREYATDRHRSVDDTPAGGGAGMVMRADVVAAADEMRSLAEGNSDAARFESPVKDFYMPNPVARASAVMAECAAGRAAAARIQAAE